MKARNGVAVMVVLFFAFAIATVLFVLISSGSTITAQNKKSLRQLQAYYLAQSALQHTMLKLRLLPKETFDSFDRNIPNPYADVDTSLQPKIAMQIDNSYSLFNASVPADDSSPYTGSYKLLNFSFDGSHGEMRHVQDGYTIHVEGKAQWGSQHFTQELTEQVIIARFTGGLK